MDQAKGQIIDASSLFHLKAELFRKQELVKQAKKNSSNEPLKRKPLKCKGEELIKKMKHDPKVEKLAVKDNAEEEELVKKSRLALEAKAKLYDKMVINQVTLGDEEQENYLVDFHRKAIDDPDYVKILVVKSSVDSEARMGHDDLYKPVSFQADQRPSHSITGQVNPQLNQVPPSAASSTNTEGPLHYQDVQYNEVRDHGIGYYAFSTDKEKRKEQMDLLQTLRQQTEKSRVSWEETKQKKKAALESRLAKICKRRNISKSVIEDYVKKDDDKQRDNFLLTEKLDTVSDVPISDIPLPDDTIIPSVMKPEKVRPWDVGKNFEERIHHSVKETKKVSQSNWIEDRRTERIEEFAPPSFYQ